MRTAVIITLQTPYKDNAEVSSFRSEERFKTIRITNEINSIRNKPSIEVITNIARKPNARPYEMYRLKRSKKNLQKVEKILPSHSTKKPLKMADR